ncbi:hypothetical protein [Bartonella machadoae]|uniref:hypothetical protein n=1 Tax=Bartonella machadoae TaxID=2893471 RepID=UPI001F4CC7D3|nr:hypothetical protein [Bartonella machadoae]UNE55135.1 hypothetical protein LNM86_04710 [Bartonella machadoae]
MLKYICAFIAIVFWDIWVFPAFAAIVKNTDLKVQSLVILEGSSPLSLSLHPHQTVTICMKGCFITFPNKDRFAIKPEDTIEIHQGRAVFQ